jgi:hypothetical protein
LSFAATGSGAAIITGVTADYELSMIARERSIKLTAADEWLYPSDN